MQRYAYSDDGIQWRNISPMAVDKRDLYDDKGNPDSINGRPPTSMLPVTDKVGEDATFAYFTPLGLEPPRPDEHVVDHQLSDAELAAMFPNFLKRRAAQDAAVAAAKKLADAIASGDPVAKLQAFLQVNPDVAALVTVASPAKPTP